MCDYKHEGRGTDYEMPANEVKGKRGVGEYKDTLTSMTSPWNVKKKSQIRRKGSRSKRIDANRHVIVHSQQQIGQDTRQTLYRGIP